LQQAMLPERLPKCPHIETAWRYQPCEYLAGDFLNLLPLDEHHFALYVFDVSGHDIASALIAFTLARRLSPAASDDQSLLTDDQGNIAPPIEVAETLNRLYPMSENQPLYFTLLYGVLDIRDGLFRYVSAGQPGPIHISDHQATDLTSPGVPIGLFEDSVFEEHRIRLEPDDRLLVFSDGLSEVRNFEGVVFGSARLTQLAAESAGLPLETGLDHLLSALKAWRGDNRHRDDMALLAVARREPAPDTGTRLLTIQFPARPEQLADLREQIRETLNGQAISAEEIELLILAVDEACGNIIQHGYRGEPGPIAVTIDHRGNELLIGIRDWAPTIEEPDRLCGRSLDELRPGGLGLHLMHCGVDRLQYLTPPAEGGNHMEMIKRLGARK
jgi:sigma-B regulation protein RsbU (phosphoserine phosphatase)